jgi:hypothetical protein
MMRSSRELLILLLQNRLLSMQCSKYRKWKENETVKPASIMGKMRQLFMEQRELVLEKIPYPISEPRPCDECYGTGEVPDSYHDKTGKGDPCKKCNGTGMI